MRLKHRIRKLLFLGAFSGMLSFLTYPTQIGPGIIFGAFISIYFYSTHQVRSLIKLTSFIVVSTIAYYTAYLYAIIFAKGATDSPIVPIFVAGLLGTAILLTGFHFLITQLDNEKFIFLLLLGANLSFTLAIGGQLALITLFLFWQMGMTVGLGLVGMKKHGS